MTEIKICGLMRMEDVTYVNKYRPEYIGFVFADTRRRVSDELAASMRAALDPGIRSVGVFVNESAERVAALCRAHIIDLVQLHGDEDADYIRRLKEMTDNPVIKAIRVRSAGDIAAGEALPCEYLLLDTYIKGLYGGSGREFDLSLIPPLEKPFFLAGGLTAENVRGKIQTAHPRAVDISSGVEGADGWKDPEKIRRFIEKVREEEN